MQAFTFITAQTVVVEPGCSAQLGVWCKRYHAKRVFIVTDRGVVNSGILQPALDSLAAANVAYLVFEDVVADPPEAVVQDAIDKAERYVPHVVIGIGGGSSMDVAKLVSYLAWDDCPHVLDDIIGVDKAERRRLPLIQIPTTAGTGSEVTPIAIVTRNENTKAAVVAPVLLPDVALLDATLTLGLPPAVTAATGLDAMVHAVEAYTSKLKRNPLSCMLAKQALRLLNGSIVRAVEHGDDLEARSNMLLGAMLAGQAFANAPVAAVHALAYPLGGHYHLAHGVTNALMFKHVMEYNLPNAAAYYAELAREILPGGSFASEQVAARALIDHFDKLMRTIKLPLNLQEVGVPANDLDQLAQDAMAQQRLLVNNPREVTLQSALQLYQAAYEHR
ncbi:MAG TPA: iron-containing alcohol dehydrogenase [Pseudomonadales bacterium]|nr:iron-containing alcohol dehydrogenase [Pseudomonadales bacterium]